MKFQTTTVFTDNDFFESYEWHPRADGKDILLDQKDLEMIAWLRGYPEEEDKDDD